MAVYPYYCRPCDVTFDVEKPMTESHSEEHCPRCAGNVVKGVANFNVDKLCLTTGSGVSTEEFNPGLGCWTKSIKDAEKIAESRGLVPIGTEPVEKLHKRAETDRKETRANRWAEADRVKLYSD